MRIIFLFILITGFTMTQAQANSQLILETSAGQVKIKLLSEIAPNHVARISELVESGFYDGIIFHSCLLYTSPSPRDQRGSRMPSSA